MRFVFVFMIAVVVSGHAAARVGAQSATTSAPASTTARLSLANDVRPVYPATAQAAGVEGIVVAEATVDSEGRVTNVRMTKSIPLLDQPVLDAVRQWRLAAPVSATTMTVAVAFVLTPGGSPEDDVVRERPQPSWLPRDFALIYESSCAGGNLTIDSTRGVVIERAGGSAPEVSHPLRVDADDVERLYLDLVEGGYFANPNGKRYRVERPSLAASATGFEVTVVGQPVGSEVGTTDSGKNKPVTFMHELSVRQLGFWRTVTWQEPVAKTDADAKDLVALGAEIRALVARSIAKDGNTTPVKDSCLGGERKGFRLPFTGR